MRAPRAPAPPDPVRVASAQEQANTSVAIANTWLQNADEQSPQGTVVYTQNGIATLQDPSYDSNGNQTGTTERQIPRFKRTVSLTAQGQRIYDQEQDIDENTNALALTQIDRLSTTLNEPIDLNALPAFGTAPEVPTLTTDLPTPGTVETEIDDGYAHYVRERAHDAIEERLTYQIERDREARILALEHKGIFPGSEAWDREMLTFDKASNDARSQAYLAAGQEHTRTFQIEAQKQAFANDAQSLVFQQAVILANFSNEAQSRQYQLYRDLTDVINVLRERAFQELLTVRNQSVNEISGLANGQQLQLPQFTGFRPGHISDTPLAQSIYQSSAIEQSNYRFRVQQQQQMTAGLISLGGSLATTPFGPTGGSLVSRFVGGFGS